MRPDLPETYYLDNVLTLFAHVTRVYADLLEGPQLEFLQDFEALSMDARKLCIRLLNRGPDWYRASKLSYTEIGSLDAAIEELAAQVFLEVNGEIDHPTLLSLYTMPELRAFLDDTSGLKKLTRTELEQGLKLVQEPVLLDIERAAVRSMLGVDVITFELIEAQVAQNEISHRLV